MPLGTSGSARALGVHRRHAPRFVPQKKKVRDDEAELYSARPDLPPSSEINQRLHAQAAANMHVHARVRGSLGVRE